MARTTASARLVVDASTGLPGAVQRESLSTGRRRGSSPCRPLRKKPGVRAVTEILFRGEDGELVPVRPAIPRAEGGAVAALVAEGIEVDDLGLVAEAVRHLHHGVGAVGAAPRRT